MNVGYLGGLIYTYKMQYANYFRNKPWLSPCLAGRTMIVLEHDGGLKSCELRAAIANIKDFNFDFKEFLQSPILNKEIRQIARKRCFCTHVCFLIESAMNHWATYFFAFPYLFLKYKLIRRIF